MKPRFQILLTLHAALALAAPGAMAKDKDKDKKDKKKDKTEQADHDRDGRDDHDDDHDGVGKITICHIPPGNAGARHTISVSESAWGAHQKHGDLRGTCDHSDPDHRRFEDLDRNRDGRISLSEWPGGRESFDRADRNRDGVISREEYGRY